MSPGRCVAIVVTHRSREEIGACLDALRAQEGVRLELHVVDNASPDGTAEFVRTHHPDVRLIANAENVGFGRANNQVLETVPADVFVLANPDAMPSPRAVSACLDVMIAEPEIAIVAPRLVHPDGSLQPSAHGFLDLVNLFGETFGLDRVFPGTRLSSLHLRGFRHDTRREVDWIQGAFLVVRGEAARRVGGFDPAYFMYGEEMDWCYRMKRAGYRVVFLSEPPVTHIGGASSRANAGPMFVELLKSRLRFFDLHRGPVAAVLARGLVALATLARWAGWELRALQPGADAGARATRQLRVRMFRAAGPWVLRGMPLSPPGPAS